MSRLKCVLVGDSAIGKTSLIAAYTTNAFREHYNATTYDNFCVSVTVDNKPLRLELCDTAGRAEFDSLRLLSYNEANVFLLCFSVMSEASLQSVIYKWLPEVRALAPDVPVILCGTQSDLRHNLTKAMELKQRGIKPLTEKQIKKIADQHHLEVFECSALTHQNLKNVFDAVIVSSMSPKKQSSRGVDRNGSFNHHQNQQNGTPVPPPHNEKHKTGLKESFRKLVTMTRRLM
uniref:Rho-related GTP-binding protein RhoU n=1 Tax=Panagrellus redivivus TaxID=6233 RepID=A0A7E4VZL7_PANRE